MYILVIFVTPNTESASGILRVCHVMHLNHLSDATSESPSTCQAFLNRVYLFRYVGAPSMLPLDHVLRPKEELADKLIFSGIVIALVLMAGLMSGILYHLIWSIHPSVTTLLESESRFARTRCSMNCSLSAAGLTIGLLSLSKTDIEVAPYPKQLVAHPSK